MSKFEQENQPFADDLDWLAFCYVAGELQGKPLEDFEARLANDQTVRDAVVHAMELATDVYESRLPESQIAAVSTSSSMALEPNSESIRRNWNWSWAVVVAAVLVLAIVGVSQWVQWNNGSESIAADSSPEDLAIAWVDALNDAELLELPDLADELGFEEGSSQEWLMVALSELENESLEAAN